MTVLVMDVGTTRLKWGLVEAGSLLTSSSTATEQLHDPQDPPGVWRVATLLSAVDRVVAWARGRDAGLAEIRISTHMRGMAVTAAGTVPTRYRTWQAPLAEVRGRTDSDVVEELCDALDDGAFSRTGTVIRAGSPLAQLWSRKRAGLPAPDVVHTLGSLLAEHLVGRCATHVTSAAATGLFDVVTRRWSTPMLDLVGIDAASMPDVVDDLEVLGTSRRTGAVVRPEVGDHQASAVGAGLASRGCLLLSVGTASLLSRWTPAPVRRPGAEVRPAAVGGGWLLTAVGLPRARDDIDDATAVEAFAAAAELIDPDHEATQIIVGGGGAARWSTSWPALADRTGRRVEVHAGPDLALLGLAAVTPAALRATVTCRG